MFSINLQSLFDFRSISFGKLRQSSRCANHLGSNRGLTRRDDNPARNNRLESIENDRMKVPIVFKCVS